MGGVVTDDPRRRFVRELIEKFLAGDPEYRAALIVRENTAIDALLTGPFESLFEVACRLASAAMDAPSDRTKDLMMCAYGIVAWAARQLEMGKETKPLLEGFGAHALESFVASYSESDLKRIDRPARWEEARAHIGETLERLKAEVEDPQ
jgi:hypothetical protein